MLNRSCLGIDLLTKAELSEINSENGYLSLARQQLRKFGGKIQHKPTLVLDVDHTLMFVRYFADECRVGDTVMYQVDKPKQPDLGSKSPISPSDTVISLSSTMFDIMSESESEWETEEKPKHSENDGTVSIPAVVTAVIYQLQIQYMPKVVKHKRTLSISRAIQKPGQRVRQPQSNKGKVTVLQHVVTSYASQQKLERSKKFSYVGSNNVKYDATLCDREVVGCIIELKPSMVPKIDNKMIDLFENKAITVSFVTDNDQLNRMTPNLERQGYVPVDLIYAGYLIRLRPDLAEFLDLVGEEYEIILFTAADKNLYKNILTSVHEVLLEELGRSRPLWSKVFYRDSCTMYRLGKNQKLEPTRKWVAKTDGMQCYYLKDLTILGRDLSQVVIVDNNSTCFRGFEPNAIRIAEFWGHDVDDKELINVIVPVILDAVYCPTQDVRFALCDMNPPSRSIRSKLSKRHSQHAMRVRTMLKCREFLSAFARTYIHNEGNSSYKIRVHDEYGNLVKQVEQTELVGPSVSQ